MIAVLGSVTPPGRLHAAVSQAAERGTARASSTPARSTPDIAPRTIAEREAVLLATPVYRGTYTGVLKVLLDALPVSALRGKPVGIAAMGATDHHSLGADWHLRDVLAWFGAFVAPTSVYLTCQTHEDGNPAGLDALLETLAALAVALPTDLGPPPLAAAARQEPDHACRIHRPDRHQGRSPRPHDSNGPLIDPAYVAPLRAGARGLGL